MLGPRFPGRQVLGLSSEVKKRKRRQLSKKLRVLLPQFEQMEPRRLFATMVWAISTGGNWDVADNWVNQADPTDHHIPTATDDAMIPALGSGNSVTHSAGTDTVQSVTSSSNLILSGGTLTVTGNVAVSSGSTLSLEGGTLADATLTGSSTLVLTDSAGTLAGGVTVATGTTLDGTQNIGGQQAYAYVTGGLTLNGAINLGSASGSTYGRLYFENGPQTLSGNGTVTLGTSTNNVLEAYGPNTVATLTIGSGITVQGGSGTVGGYNSADSVVNDGRITTASGQTLTIDGSNWVNAGTITANGATVNLGGSFTTAALGGFSASGSTVNLTGTLNNANTTFTLSPAIGAWNLRGGTINGGIITSTGGSNLTLTNSGGTLGGGVTVASGTTLDGTESNGSQEYAYVTGGLTLNGAINLGNTSGSVYGDLYFENGPQTLSGNGTVTLGTSTNNYLEAFGPNTAATLTIGSGITVEGGSGTVGGYYNADSVVNDGTITSASGQTLTILGSNWVNNGTITANGATVNLGGSFTTAALGSFSASGSTVNLTGTLNNANTTFTLSPAIGAWNLRGGTINGGIITSTGGSNLTLTNSGGTLGGGVTVASGTTLDGTESNGSQEYAYVTGGLTLNGAINLGNTSGSVYGDLYFENGPQTLSGNGTVTLGTSTNNYLEAYGPNTAATLTIGSGITVEGGSGTVGGYYSADSVVNDGTINSASGQTLTIDGSNWVNNGTITANGATVNLGGSFTTAALGSFSASGSTVNLTGTLNNANATFTLSPAIGAWNLRGGTINGGTITSTGGSKLVLTKRRWNAGRRRDGRYGNHAGRDREHRHPGVCLRHRRPDPQRRDQPGEHLGKRLRRPVLRERPPDAIRQRYGDVRHVDQQLPGGVWPQHGGHADHRQRHHRRGRQRHRRRLLQRRLRRQRRNHQLSERPDADH